METIRSPKQNSWTVVEDLAIGSSIRRTRCSGVGKSVPAPREDDNASHAMAATAFRISDPCQGVTGRGELLPWGSKKSRRRAGLLPENCSTDNAGTAVR